MVTPPWCPGRSTAHSRPVEIGRLRHDEISQNTTPVRLPGVTLPTICSASAHHDAATPTRTVGTVHTSTTIDSPVGPLTLVNSDGVLCGLHIQPHARRPDRATFGDAISSGVEREQFLLTLVEDPSRTVQHPLFES